MLTQSQKLRLYALFQQSQRPAPSEPPPPEQTVGKQGAIKLAKWEAWNDVRTLNQTEAMDAYAEIIEGLIKMMAAFDQGGDDAPSLLPPDAEAHVPNGNATATASSSGEPQGGGEQSDESEDAEDDDEDADDGESEEEDDEPTVTPTIWSTAGMNVPPGDTITVPLAFDAPCRCSYSFSIVSGTGPIAFHVHGPEKAQLLSKYEDEAEGSFEVALPPAASGSAMLTITLDNTASTFSSIEVKCQVLLEPLAELQQLARYRARKALRGLIARKEHTLYAHTQTYAKVGRAAQELQALVSKLKEQLTVAESQIKIKYKQLEQGAEMAEIMNQEIHELQCQLRQAP